MLANKFIIVDYLHTPHPTGRATHLDKKATKKGEKKNLASTCHIIMAWQSTIYQHQLKRNYKLPKMKLEIKTCPEFEKRRLKAHTPQKKKGKAKSALTLTYERAQSS